jgi:RNA polymerase sigma factor (sigma-70 family)
MWERLDGQTVAELVAAAQAGDNRSWEELVRRYGGMVEGVANNLRLQDADVADAVQNTWLRAIEQLRSLREPERFGGWLKMIAYRESLGLPARARREYLDATVTEQVVEPSPGPEALAVAAEMRRAVRAAVDTLSGRRRTIVETLFFRPRIDYALAAEVAGVPLGSVGPSRARALATLRQRLEQAGFAPESADAARAR